MVPTYFSVASVLCLIIMVSLKSSVAHNLPHHLKNNLLTLVLFISILAFIFKCSNIFIRTILCLVCRVVIVFERLSLALVSLQCLLDTCPIRRNYF